jgi:hypothetical protein
MLTYLNNKFTASSSKTKIELYLLPLMVLYLLYYFSNSLFVFNKPAELKNQIDFKEYENKKFQGSFLELFSDIEEKAEKHNIQVLSLTNKNNMVDLKIEAKKEQITIFIKEIENINSFTKIDSIIMYDKKDSSIYLFDLKIDLNKFYIKKFEKIKKIGLIDSQKILVKPIEVKNNNTTPEKSYELKAIISNYVLINDIWLKKGEKIDDFYLKEIKRNSIILESENIKIELELINEKYLENIY